MSEQTPTTILANISQTTSRPQYLIFYSSPEDRGRPWCRDCRLAYPIIAASGISADSIVIHVGDRDS